MESDRIKWNQKYRRKDYPSKPADIVKRFCHLASGGHALDIAAGNGRNAVYLAERGFRVDAIDIAEEGLALFPGKHPGVRKICADLDRYEITPGRYILVLNIKFLNRRLFPLIFEGLRPGGVLIFQTFLVSPDIGDDAHCRDYLLRENELLHAFIGMKIIFYEEAADPEGRNPNQVASLVAVKR
jgi:SAM-dependent methyltransferase